MARSKASTAPPSPPVWSRSPSEYYLKYALTADPDTELDVLVQTFQGMGVVLPPRSVEYLAQLQARLDEKMPDPFFPKDLRHRASQKFLRDEGIWSMWHPDRAIEEADHIFSRPILREQVSALLVSGFGSYQITRLLSHHSGFTCSEGGISAFRHYYWNIDLLTSEEKERVYNDARVGSVIQRAHLAGRSLGGRASVLSHLGYAVQPPPARSVFEDLLHYTGKFLSDLERMPPERRGRELVNYSTAALNALRGVVETQASSASTQFVELAKMLSQSRVPVRPVSIADLGSSQFNPRGLPGRGAVPDVDQDLEEEGNDVGPQDRSRKAEGAA